MNKVKHFRLTSESEVKVINDWFAELPATTVVLSVTSFNNNIYVFYKE